MLISGNSLRLTPEEREEHQSVGVNVEHVRSRDQYARAVEVWALCLAEVRPDVLRKFDDMLIKAVEQKRGSIHPVPPTA
jgi:hypothetical protein